MWSRALSERQNFEKEAIAATQQLEKLQLDNGDIIQYLQRTLQSRDDQCSELKERLHGLQLVGFLTYSNIDVRVICWCLLVKPICLHRLVKRKMMISYDN